MHPERLTVNGVDIFELAKQAKKNQSASTNDDPSAIIQRLERKVEREKKARTTAEQTIEASSRRLYLANQALDKANHQLEATVLELNDTMSRLTSAEVKRQATTATLVVALVLFIISEFAIEPELEKSIDNTLILQLAKLGIFSLLIPFEIIASRVIESGLSESQDLNAQMYKNLLVSAYEDGIVTDMERAILLSSANQLGLSKQVAERIEREYMREVGLLVEEALPDSSSETPAESSVN
ncbi:MAG: hypothetical protein ISP84_05765 [Candidatus Poseidonia sp.]|nr:hypothetical protein [Poseidonia sp.]